MKKSLILAIWTVALVFAGWSELSSAKSTTHAPRPLSRLFLDGPTH